MALKILSDLIFIWPDNISNYPIQELKAGCEYEN